MDVCGWLKEKVKEGGGERGDFKDTEDLEIRHVGDLRASDSVGEIPVSYWLYRPAGGGTGGLAFLILRNSMRSARKMSERTAKESV